MCGCLGSTYKVKQIILPLSFYEAQNRPVLWHSNQTFYFYQHFIEFHVWWVRRRETLLDPTLYLRPDYFPLGAFSQKSLVARGIEQISASKEKDLV